MCGGPSRCICTAIQLGAAGAGAGAGAGAEAEAAALVLALLRGLLPAGFLTKPAKKLARAWLCAFSSPAVVEEVSFFWARLASLSCR